MANYISPFTGPEMDEGINTALNNVLTKNNTAPFIPAGDYHPATKKYVDDKETKIIPVSTSTGATTAAKIGIGPVDYVPEAGNIIALTLTAANTAASPTLNINGSGARNIRIAGANATASVFKNSANGTVYLIYDGTYYNMFGANMPTDTPAKATEVEARAGTNNETYMTALRTKQSIETLGISNGGSDKIVLVVGGAQPAPVAGKQILWIDLN